MIRMAKMKAKMPDELIAKLSRLGQRTDEVCEKALQAGAEVAESAISTNLSLLSAKEQKSRPAHQDSLKACSAHHR